MRSSTAAALLLALLLPMLLHAESIQNAERLAAEGKFDEAISAFREILRLESENGQAWYGLGRVLHSLDRHEEAFDSFTQAMRLGFQPGPAMLRIGMIRLQMGQKQEAREWLKKSFDAGTPVRDFVPALPGSDLVENDPELKSFVATLHPCERETYRQWDFWIGDWDVYSLNGRKIGESKVERVAGGCAISETWQSQAAGRSLSWFDPVQSLYVQHYIDSSGLSLDMTGTYIDGEIRLSTSETIAPKQRWVWAPLTNGRVSQKATQWHDSEQEWQEIWNSVYVPRGSAFDPGTH